jgi:hypothetical protein
MRKTLAVLGVISSMLLLQAPVWAGLPGTEHHLYKIDTSNSYEALTDCPSDSVVVIRPNPGAKAVRARTAGKKTFAGESRFRFTFNTSARFSPTKLKATCDGEPMIKVGNFLGASVPLAFTGRPVVPQLLLGTGLLLVGSLLVLLTGRPPLGVFRRRRLGPATPR